MKDTTEDQELSELMADLNKLIDMLMSRVASGHVEDR